MTSIAEGQVVDAQTRSFFLGEKLDDERPGWLQCGASDTSDASASNSAAAVTAVAAPEVVEENELTTGDPAESTVEANACIMDLIADGSALKPDNMHIGSMLNHCDARNVSDWQRGTSNKSQDRDHLAEKLNHKFYFPHARATLEGKKRKQKREPS